MTASNDATAADRTGVASGAPPELPGSGAVVLARFGDYELLEEIARGGMGVVYKARQVSLDRIVALKMILFGSLASPEQVRRFRIEASAAGSLQHSNIVAVHEVGLHEGQNFLVMDYVDGPNLARFIQDRPLPVKQAATYLKTIAEAIHYAHERGIMHRDLKPSNVLIGSDDRPRVTDFGLAKRFDSDSSLTLSGQVLGSPNYMPPEQAGQGAGKVGRRSDVYSLGAILYHLLTGRPPFRADTIPDTLRQVHDSEPLPPRLLNPSVPRDLETICLKCLAKEPAKRFASAEQLADDLERFLHHEPIRARAVSHPERVWRWCRRKPALASLAAATSVLLLAILIGSPIAIYRINQALKRAEAAELMARRNQYASDMNLAHQAVNEGDLFRALRLLDRNRPSFGVPASAGSAANNGSSHPDRLKAGLQTDLRGWEWGYLWQQCQGEQLFILGQHSKGVRAVGVLPDGNTVYSGGNDGTVRFWDMQSKRQTGLLQHEAPVTGAACSPDGRWLATGTEAKIEPGPGVAVSPKSHLRLWDLATGTKVTVLSTNFWLRPTIVFAPNNNLLAVATTEHNIRLWSLTPLQEVTNLPAYFHFQGPLGLAFSRDGQMLAYNENEGGDIVLWDIHNRSVIRRLKGHSWYVMTLAFTPDGQTLASSSADKTVKLWDWAAGSERVTFTNYSGPVGVLRISPDGQRLATAARFSGQQVTLQELPSGREVLQLRGHQDVISDVVFSPDGGTLFTSSADGSVRAWDVMARPKQADRRQFSAPLAEFDGGSGVAVGFSPDGTHMLSVFKDDSFSVWDTLTLTESQHHPLPVSPFACAALTSAGEVAAFVARDGNVVFWQSASGETNWFSRPTTDLMNRAAFSRDGKRLAMSGDRELCVCEVASKRTLHKIPLRGEYAFSLALSHDGQKLMAGCASGVVKVWDLGRQANEVTLRGHTKEVEGLALSPDGRTLVSVSDEILFWDLDSQRELTRIRPRSTKCFGCSISPDGRRLAVGAADGLITLWDLASLQEVATLKGHERRLVHVAFSSEGNALLSVSPEQVRVWRAASLTEADSVSAKLNEP